MCLGIPGRVVERYPSSGNELIHGLVEFDGLRRRVCLDVVPDAMVGDYVIVHAGIAISRLDAAEATRLLEHLREMGETAEFGDESP
jgi:hydrogenase expression/formation protein HypC